MSGAFPRLCRRLGHEFAQAELLAQALTHRSAAGRHNERLEFLGDAILGFVITEELYRRFPKATEGELSRRRAHLVKGETLARLARELELGEHLALGSGELKSGGFRRQSILADAMEAVLAAVYLDAGLERTREVILGLFAGELEKVAAISVLKDPKTRLQEYLQGRQLELPEYEVTQVSGKSHEQTFSVRCRVAALEVTAEGSGSSRRRAEQAAAETILQQLEAAAR